MKKKILTVQVLLALAMSAVVFTTGMAEDIEIKKEELKPIEVKEDVTQINSNENEGYLIKSEEVGIKQTKSEKGNLTLKSAENVIATTGNDHAAMQINGTGDITLTATKGANDLRSEQDDGISSNNDYEGVIKLEGQQNSVVGAADGISTQGKQVDLIASDYYQANYVKGGHRGIVAAGGKVTLTAENGENVVLSEEHEAKNQGQGISASAGGTVTLEGASNRVIDGYEVEGASIGNQAFRDGTAIHAEGENSSVALNASGNNFLLGQIDAQNHSSVKMDGRNNDGANNTIYSANTVTSSDKTFANAIFAQKQASVMLNAGSGGTNTIYSYAAEGGDSRTVWASQGSQISITGKTIISTNPTGINTMSGESGAQIALAAGTDDWSSYDKENEDFKDKNRDGLPDVDFDASDSPYKRSTVAVTYGGGSEIDGDIVSGFGGNITIEAQDAGNGISTYSGEQGITVNGSALAGNGGQLTMKLSSGSVWTGRADDYQDADSKQEIAFYNPAFSNEVVSKGNINIELTNSTWYVTGQSWVTNLSGSGSTIDLTNGISGNFALHLGTLNGQNTFVMNLNRTDHENSEMIYIADVRDSSGEQTVRFNRIDGITEMANGEKLRFATVNAATDKLSFVTDEGTATTHMRDVGLNDMGITIKSETYNTADAANTEYNGQTLTENKAGNSLIDEYYQSGTNWYLTRNSSADELSDAGKTVIAMSRVNYSNAVYMDRLNKRMGEARYIDGDDGLWVRLRHDRIGKDDAFRSMNTMFELGYDWHAKGQKDGEHRQGVAFDYMRGTADYKNVAGDGDVRRAGVWLYDTWLGDKGHYSDYVVKYGRLSNDFDIYSELGEKISGDYDNDVWSVSAEYGRKKDIGNDWYFEPQVQAQYAYVTSADYTTSQGTKVNLDSIDSLIGRAGFRLGRDTSEGNTVYFKADVLHEFLGDQSIRAHDATGTLSTTYENEGTWYDVGFGFAHRMGKDSYVFLDVEHSFGNDNDDTYQINIGLNHAF